MKNKYLNFLKKDCNKCIEHVSYLHQTHIKINVHTYILYILIYIVYTKIFPKILKDTELNRYGDKLDEIAELV